MKNHFIVTDNSQNVVSQNLETDCRNCLSNCESKGSLIDDCPIYDSKRRQGILTNSKGTTFLCCGTTKTTKLFKEKLNALSYAYHDLVIPKNSITSEIKKSEQKKVNRLVHNLTSINAHNIQEIYNLIPQDLLSSNWRSQVDFIEKELKSNPSKAAMVFLRIAKHNIHMKSEFSIYRKLDRDDSAELDFKTYPIRTVLLNVLHTFFGDFSSKSVYVSVADFFGKVAIDYETIQVALYHLIENAQKYSKNDSTIKIDFIDNENSVSIKMEMISLFIKESEREKIFEEGISGINAQKLHKSGDGIGLWRIKQMLELNNGKFEIICGNEIELVRGVEFGNNIFILEMNKKLP